VEIEATLANCMAFGIGVIIASKLSLSWSGVQISDPNVGLRLSKYFIDSRCRFFVL